MLSFTSCSTTRRTALLMLSLYVSTFASEAQSIDISLPISRAVYQRNEHSQAKVPIAIQFKNSAISNFSYKIDKLDTKTGSDPSPVTISTHTTPLNGLFDTALTLSAGWYQLVIQGYGQSGALIATSSIRFGVGEVIYSAGQSNSQGVELGPEGTPLLSGAPYDGLSVINQNCFCKRTFPFPIFEKMERGSYDTQKKIAPNGNQNLWYYEVLGRKLSDINNGIPIAIFNAGSTGTTVDNWSESANNPNAITHSPWFVNCSTDIPVWGSEGAQGQPYHALKTALNFYGGMFGARVVLWHQGESDNYIGIDSDSYQQRLLNVISRSRQHFSDHLGWAISRVSHFPPYSNNSAVIQAQENIKNSLPNSTWGAFYSDNLTGAGVFRQSDDLHFNANGLIALGEQFATGTSASYSMPAGRTPITSLTPVDPLQVPEVKVADNAGNYTLTVSGDYSSYCWVQNDGSISDCQHTTQSITVSAGKWRCYVTHIDSSPTSNHEKRNVSLTRNIELPLVNFTPPLGLPLSISPID